MSILDLKGWLYTYFCIECYVINDEKISDMHRQSLPGEKTVFREIIHGMLHDIIYYTEISRLDKYIKSPKHIINHHLV